MLSVNENFTCNRIKFKNLEIIGLPENIFNLDNYVYLKKSAIVNIVYIELKK